MIIAVVGKGGVGKTTISALLLRQLIQSGQTPVLALDADPSSCLGALLGVSVDPARTLGALRDRVRRDEERPASVPKSDWLAIMAEEAMVEQTGFDLLTMGHPEGPGCYCFVNNLVRDYLTRLARAYRHVLVDCEAGQEHLSRRTTGRPDVLMCVVDRSRLSAVAVRRCLALFESLHERLPRRVELVLNRFEPDEPLAEELSELARAGLSSFNRITRVPTDPAIAQLEAAERSLMELGPGARASRALQDWRLEP